MVTLTTIYTRGGDKGETSLADGSRIRKDDLRVEAYGTVDEANSCIGIARHETPALYDAMLESVQHDMFDLGADLSTPYSPDEPEGKLRIIDAQVVRLEEEIDHMNAGLTPLSSFVLPGGSRASADLHLARSIVRRAERLAVHLASNTTINPACIQYLNRLSDHLFVMARCCNHSGLTDVLWKPGKTR